MGQRGSKSTKRRKESSRMASNEYASAFPLTDLPDDLLTEVFIRLPAQYLVQCCVLVCKHWNIVLSTQKLWKDKFLRDYCVPDEVLSSLGTENFRVLYFKNPYISNLIDNPDASQGMKHWNVLQSRGNGFQVEASPVGSHPVSKGNSLPGKTTGCWATSYGECEKEQVIDLLEKGCVPEVLDNIRPDIIVSEKYAARFDCGIKYKVAVQLLSQTKQVLSNWEFSDIKQAGRDWFSAEFTFANYKPGVRFIRFVHEGIDTQFWAGYYGAKMTLATVKFDFSHKAGPWKPEEEEGK